MGRIRALAIAVQRRGCHAVHRPSSPTLVRGRLRRAGKEASESAVPFGESSLAPPSLLPSVVARLSLLPERSEVIPEHWSRLTTYLLTVRRSSVHTLISRTYA